MEAGSRVGILAAVIITVGVFLLNPSHQYPSESFKQWKQKFGKVRSLQPSEETYRARVFEDNLAMINQHNRLQGTSYKMAANQFAALTQKEFQTMYLGDSGQFQASQPQQTVQTPSKTSLKMDVDWERAGKVSSVKDSGQCLTSSYAFAAVGAIEGSISVKYRVPIDLSVQQIIDCATTRSGNRGCEGGTMRESLTYASEKGMMKSSDYPWQNGQFSQCQFSTGPYKIKGYRSIYTCEKLDDAIQEQPLGVTISMTDRMRFYAQGIYRSEIYYTPSYNMVLVGLYDDEIPEKAYYRLKNSWGRYWGESGYIRIAKDSKVNCGMCYVIVSVES